MSTAMAVLFGMLCAYLAGSINFAILLFRLLGRDDPRARFSGNAGVTNVYRQAGWPPAAMVLMLDVGRAVVVALMAGHIWGDALVPWAGLALVHGNRFPCFHGFRGGKGVASYLGFFGVLLPLGTGLSLAVYLMVFALTRVSFLGSFGVLATVTGFGLVRWSHEPSALAALLLTTVSIVWFHRGNITAWRGART